jgi:DNA-directed RNA polymerase II subunit RPB1
MDADMIAWALRRIPDVVRKPIRKQLEALQPSDLEDVNMDQFEELLYKTYQQTLVEPGESTGILTAQSIGERQTQMTLSSFHNCGLLNSVVTSGVPRFVELINCTKDLKNVYTRIFPKPGVDASEIATTFVYTSLRHLVRYYECLPTADMLKPECWWNTHLAESSSNDDKNDKEHVDAQLGLRLFLDARKVKERSLCLSFVTACILKAYGELAVTCSSMREGIIDVWIASPECVDAPKARVGRVTPDNYMECFYIDFLVSLLMKVHVAGIKGITGFAVEPAGSVLLHGGNLAALLSHPQLQPEKLYTNSLVEILATFGLEATRQFLIDEFISVLSTDGVVINTQHIFLLVDNMIHSGELRSVSRYSLRHKPSALARSSFEEVIENVLCAAVHNEVDPLTSVSSNVMTAKIMKAGSGYMDIIYDYNYQAEVEAAKAGTDTLLDTAFEWTRLGEIQEFPLNIHPMFV